MHNYFSRAVYDLERVSKFWAHYPRINKLRCKRKQNKLQLKFDILSSSTAFFHFRNILLTKIRIRIQKGSLDPDLTLPRPHNQTRDHPCANCLKSIPNLSRLRQPICWIILDDLYFKLAMRYSGNTPLPEMLTG